jgi:hypothetical protein
MIALRLETRAGALAVAILAMATSLHAASAYQDDFTVARGRYEFVGGNVWNIKDGQCRFSAPSRDCFAVLNSDELSSAKVRGTVTVSRRAGSGFVTAGLTLFSDSEDHWRLLLVAGPDGAAKFELVERYQGVHQAQRPALATGTSLAAEHDGNLNQWQYGTAYELTLSLTPQGVTGEIRDPVTGGFWRTRYSLVGRRAERSGRPGFCADGVEGILRQFSVVGSPVASGPAIAMSSGPAGSVAIVRDESGRIAAGLKGILSEAGYGVTLLTWESLARGHLSPEALDLLVLADARRLPDSAARCAMALLRARGKLLAVGAPAFREFLVATPRGYVEIQRYGETIYDLLAKRSIPLATEKWRHASRESGHAAKIEPADQGSTGHGWRVACDYAGWDVFGQSIAGAFAGGHTLLCFRARGDADTPQLAVECIEKDGARWIATVELSSRLRAYVLRPLDFGYWKDSKARRGGGGDRFNPANAARISLGLSSSHTPKAKAGAHTYWISDFATAIDPNFDQPQTSVPELEGLSPSYKLYPLDQATSLRAVHPIAEPGSAIVPGNIGYAPNWRAGGIGFDRQRPVRLVRLVDAFDAQQRDRGSIAWLMLGESTLPGAMWANMGLADPAVLLGDTPQGRALREAFLRLSKAMTRGTFLLEAGSRQFSYYPEERVDLGAMVLNASRKPRSLAVRLTVNDAAGKVRFEKTLAVTVPSDERREVRCQWTPRADAQDVFPCTVHVQLVDGAATIDRISHTIEQLPTGAASHAEFVTAAGSHFMQGGNPWYMRGVNYRPNDQGGLAPDDMLARDRYDPEIIERDMAWMESAGINALSAVHASTPLDADAPDAYRDTQDFLNRCRRHGMKVFYFLPWGNPMNHADVAAIKKHINAAGIKNHPAIFAWELAWEPIYTPGSSVRGMQQWLPDWNAWIVERYGSLANAERDWGFALPRLTAATSAAGKGKLAANKAAVVETVDMPQARWCGSHGPWDRAVAAFRRFFSDRIGRGYGDVIRELSDYDSNHLITFRFGACGIPEKAHFAHCHSAAVAKHVSFLCPEGYNLQPLGPSHLSPADAIREGGLVTLYYRFISREKPVVWMEFGYTCNGMNAPWTPERVQVSPAELDDQRTEFENFYQMFIESGARGAAPWWLPGGFRLGENSDFGILEPDGTERPACQVVRSYLPKFAAVGDSNCVADACQQAGPDTQVITLDLDAHYADAWEFYGPQYLAAVKAGRRPLLRTAGSGSTSADCPLLALGGTPLDGHNPPLYLDAEFSSVELQESRGAPWREVSREDVVTVKRGAEVRCRAMIGNTAEAAWLAPKSKDRPELGTVLLRLGSRDGQREEPLLAAIAATTPYLGDAETAEFALPLPEQGREQISLQLQTTRKSADGRLLTIPFGERRSVTIRVLP